MYCNFIIVTVIFKLHRLLWTVLWHAYDLANLQWLTILGYTYVRQYVRLSVVVTQCGLQLKSKISWSRYRHWFIWPVVTRSYEPIANTTVYVSGTYVWCITEMSKHQHTLSARICCDWVNVFLGLYLSDICYIVLTD